METVHAISRPSPQRREIQMRFGGEVDENPEYLTEQILTYLGNKRSLLHFIGDGVERVKRETGKEKISFFDAFSGSGIVSRYLKRHSSLIIANDLEYYSTVVNKCYLTNKREIDERDFDNVFETWKKMAAENPVAGLISRNYAPADNDDIKKGERVFYTHENAIVLDSARHALDLVPKTYFNLLLGPLLAEASIHPNTSGVFKGFYKNRQGIGAFGGEGRNALSRIRGRIRLEKPVLSNFECKSIVIQNDANETAKTMPPVDLAYFDPPYNQHPYGSNYFMLNILARNENPAETSKVSGIPKGWNHSLYNCRNKAEMAFFDLLAHTPARYLMVSYNSEGFIGYDSFIRNLGQIGKVTSLEIEYNTFRGSRNLRNRSLKVKEYLFLVKK